MKPLLALLLFEASSPHAGAANRVDELKILLDLAKQEATTVNTIWTFYFTVALGIAGWFAAAGKDRLSVMSMPSRLTIAAAFLAFVVVNWLSLFFNYNLLDSFLTDIHGLLPDAMPHATATAKMLQPVSDYCLFDHCLPISLLVQPAVSAAVIGLLLRLGIPAERKEPGSN
jgi:hypothetical protein